MATIAVYNSSANMSKNLTLPRASKPPKLQHILVKNRHDLVKATARDNSLLDTPDFETEHDPNNDVPCPSDEELEEVDAGETPRGDKSMIIKTEHGNLKSKYHYLGFGLWENTEPCEPKPHVKPSPPSPPPKAEPIWYNCSVKVETQETSKELDDLVHTLEGLDGGQRVIEKWDVPAPVTTKFKHEKFIKEDMSDMFREAMLAKMALVDEKRAKYKCYICTKLIYGRIITAMSHKFHPECFVCTYCRQEFKERSFKTDKEGKPYCYECFEKLLGYFGTVHFKLKELVIN